MRVFGVGKATVGQAQHAGHNECQRREFGSIHELIPGGDASELNTRPKESARMRGPIASESTSLCRRHDRWRILNDYFDAAILLSAAFGLVVRDWPLLALTGRDDSLGVDPLLHQE